jgi:hypothetical protein
MGREESWATRSNQAGSGVQTSAAFLARLARDEDPVLVDDVIVDVDQFEPKAKALE